MDQNLLLQASFFQKQVEEMESNISLIDQQIEQMNSFKESLEYLEIHPSNEILSSLGNGVFIKANPTDKKLFVNVGANVVVKKTPKATLEVVQSQISKLNEARASLASRLEIYYHQMRQIIEKIQQEEEGNSE